MSILSKLPIIGRGSYEPNFRVKFKDDQKGLESIVDLATSQQSGTFVLGEAKLPELVANLHVYLNPGASSTRGNAAYILEAVLSPYAGQRLQVHRSAFTNEGFEMHGIIEKVYGLSSHMLPSDNEIDVRIDWPGNESGINLHHSLVYSNSLTRQQVKDAITAFAKALEVTVNSAYGLARKSAPKQALVLSDGEKLKLLHQKTSDRTTFSRVKPPEDADAAKASLEALTSVTFSDVGGYQNVKDEIDLWLRAIRSPELATKHGYTPAKGILLYGPPGTGKTLFGKAIAGEAGAQFFYVSPTTLIDKYVGESPKRLREMFVNAGNAAESSEKPVIVFIDDIDAILARRSGSSEGGSGVRQELLAVFNEYMDGFLSGQIKNVYLVAATNVLDQLDPAAVRPPRFVHIEVPLPDLEARVAIFKVRAEAKEREAGGAQLFSPDINYETLAKLTEGYSGAEISNLAESARADAFDEAQKKGLKEPIITTQADIEAAIAADRNKPVTDKRDMGILATVRRRLVPKK